MARFDLSSDACFNRFQMSTESAIENARPISIKNDGIGKKKIESIAMMPLANPMSRALLRSLPAEPGNEISDIQLPLA